MAETEREGSRVRVRVRVTVTVRFVPVELRKWGGRFLLFFYEWSVVCFFLWRRSRFGWGGGHHFPSPSPTSHPNHHASRVCVYLFVSLLIRTVQYAR